MSVRTWPSSWYSRRHTAAGPTPTAETARTQESRDAMSERGDSVGGDRGPDRVDQLLGQLLAIEVGVPPEHGLGHHWTHEHGHRDVDVDVGTELARGDTATEHLAHPLAPRLHDLLV